MLSSTPAVPDAFGESDSFPFAETFGIALRVALTQTERVPDGIALGKPISVTDCRRRMPHQLDTAMLGRNVPMLPERGDTSVR